MAELGSDSSAVRPRVDHNNSAKHGRLGPYSRIIDRGVLGTEIDGRSREGRFLAAYQAMLTEHLGGKPSIVQRALIHRAARLALHLELMDERSLAGGTAFTTHDHHFYVAWSNPLARLLSRLGMDAATAKQPSLLELLANR